MNLVRKNCEKFGLGVTQLTLLTLTAKMESDKHHNEQLIHKALRQYHGDVSHVIVATRGGLVGLMATGRDAQPTTCGDNSNYRSGRQR